MSVTIGTAYIICPECDVSIPVPVDAKLTQSDHAVASLDCKPDLTDLWAHAWSHEEIRDE